MFAIFSVPKVTFQGDMSPYLQRKCGMSTVASLLRRAWEIANELIFNSAEKGPKNKPRGEDLVSSFAEKLWETLARLMLRKKWFFLFPDEHIPERNRD